MRNVLTLIGLLLVFFHTPGMASGVQDQAIGHRIGVSIPSGQSELPGEAQLRTLRDAGVTLIELDGTYPADRYRELADAGFFLFIRQDRSFTTRFELTTADSLFLAEDRALITRIQTAAGNRFAAFAPFRYPDERSRIASDGLALYGVLLTEMLDTPPTLYYLSAFPDATLPPAPFGFRSVRLPAAPEDDGARPVIHFPPENQDLSSLRPFRSILEYTLTQENSIIFLDYEWFQRMVRQFEPLTQSLQAYTTNNELLFPLPAASQEAPVFNWPVLFFLTLFGFWLIQYRYEPVYRRALFRYLVSHKFFIEEIIENRVRMPNGSLFLFTLHMLLTGVFAYLASDYLLSPLGMDALAIHFPLLGQVGMEPPGFFFWGILLAIVIQLLSLLWLHLPAFRTRSIGQTQKFYGWPLQLNLPVTLLLIGFLQAGSSAVWIHACLILFPVIWFLSFYIAAFDTARTHSRPFLYILGTCGLHLSLSGLLFYLILYSPRIWQPVTLALGFP